MKVMLVLLVLGLFVLAGGVTFTGWYSTTDSNGVVHVHCLSGCTSGTYAADGTSLPGSPVVKDAIAVHNAGYSSAKAGQATKRMVAVLNRATNSPTSQAERLVRHDLPPLLTTIIGEIPGVRANLLAVDVQTTAGQSCRLATLREVSTLETVYRRALDATDAGRSPAQIVYLVVAGGNAAHRAYESDVRPCLAGLQPDDRAAVKYIMGG